VHRPHTVTQGNLGHLVSKPGLLGSRLFLDGGDFMDTSHLRRIVTRVRPNEIYHFAGQSSPRLSLEMPESTVASVGAGTLKLLEIVRDLPDRPRMLYAASAEIFGSAPDSPQTEQTPIQPTTPYGVAKAFSYQLTKLYRQNWGFAACSAILYNHESPRRGAGFVTMKVAQAAARIKLGLQDKVVLGNLAARRDWGWAPDYVEAMWRMLQQPKVDDYILATGTLHSVEEWVDACFRAVGLDWRSHVVQDPKLIPAVEPIAPCGSPEKARRQLGWFPTTDFSEMARKMVESALSREPQG
jgi:GDPmannose 4,6-dehydratase